MNSRKEIIHIKYINIYFLNSSPQDGEYESNMPSLLLRNWYYCLPSALVNTYTTWYLEGTYPIARSPGSDRSRPKWQSISLRLVRSWNTRFFETWSVAWLSQKSFIGLSKKMPIAAKKVLIQIISPVAIVMALYSASSEDCDTVPCFFISHAISNLPRVTRNPTLMNIWTMDMHLNLRQIMHKLTKLNHVTIKSLSRTPF